MEKITSWRRRDAEGKSHEDSYFYDDGFIIVVRDGQKPEESNERLKADAVMVAYSARPYDKLMTHSQHTYDFLKAKGY